MLSKYGFIAAGMFLVSLTMMGCSSTKEQNLFADYPDEMTRFSIVSLAQPGLILNQGQSIGMHPNLSKSFLDNSAEDARPLLNSIFAESIKKRGLQFNPYVRAKSNYWLGYAILLHDMANDQNMVNQYGMAPGFMNHHEMSYEKGSLVVDLVEANTRRVVLRGSVAGLVAPDMPEDLRRIRLESAIGELLSHLPVE